MARAGTNPKPTKYHLVADYPGGKREIREIPQLAVDHDNGLKPPKGLTKREKELWDQYVRRAPWLTQFDVPRAHMWVKKHAEWEEDPAGMNAAMIAQLRFLGSELGFEPSARSKMGDKKYRGKKQKDPADEFFGPS